MSNGIKKITVQAAIKRWFVHLQRYSKQTQRQYRQIIRKFTESLPDIFISQLSTRHIQDYIDARLEHHSNRTANSHLTTIKSFCKYIDSNYDVWESNPASKVKMLREGPTRQRVLSDEEYKKVLAVCNSYQADIIKLLANTGLRSCEFRKLHLAKIGPNCRTLYIIGKGNKPRVIPFNKTACEIFNRHRKPEFDLSEKLQSQNALWMLCRRLAAKADIEPFGPHALRHRFATKMILNNNLSLSKIARVMGHSSVLVLEKVYLHWVDEVDLAGLTDYLDGLSE